VFISSVQQLRVMKYAVPYWVTNKRITSRKNSGY